MTLCLGVALSDCALVAAETRCTALVRNGDGAYASHVASDGEPLLFDTTDGVEELPTAPRFVRALAGQAGVFTGTMTLPLGMAAMHVLETSDVGDEALARRLQSLTTTWLARLDNADVHERVQRGFYVLARPAADGYRLSMVHPVHARWTHKGVGGLMLNLPPELSQPGYAYTGPIGGPLTERQATATAAVQRFGTELKAARTLAARLRALAAFFLAVYQLCGPEGTVNDQLEVGVVDPTGLRYLPPTPAGVVLDAAPLELDGLLEPMSARAVQRAPIEAATGLPMVLDLGEVAYVSALAYEQANAAGLEGPLAQARSVQPLKKAGVTKTLTIPACNFVAENSATGYFVLVELQHTDANGVDRAFVSTLTLPPGVTMTDVEMRGKRNATTDKVTCSVHRVTESTGSLTQLALLTHSTTGYQNVAASLTEVVDTSPYLFEVILKHTSANTDALFQRVRVTYTMPSYDKTY